jgi:hypothetical protein
MSTVFVDESGYTGPDLLNPDQPIFALASLDFTEDECRLLKTNFFGEVKATELKSSQLMRKPRGQRMILKFMKELMKRQDRTRVAYMHKPFALLCKSIDWIVEPYLRRNGVNLYLRGGNLALSNLTFCMLQEEPEYRTRLFQALQLLMTEFSRDTFAQACDVLAEKTGQIPNLNKGPLAETLQHLYFGLVLMHPMDTGFLGKQNLDLCFSLALAMMGSWAKKFGENFSVFHDQSSNMSSQREQWNAIVTPNVDDKIVGYDRRTMQYPIRVNKTLFEPSDKWAGIQLADVLSGVVGRCLKTKYGFSQVDAFSDDLWSHFQGWDLCAHVTPEAKFTPDELGTDGPRLSCPYEFMANVYQKALGGEHSPPVEM